MNNFFTQTEWLPRLDHFWLGQPLAQDTLTRYGHSSAGYARFLPAATPYDPGEASIFKLLPWETSAAEGERFVTNQEIDLPMSAGPAKVVPYLFGQAGHWGEDLMGNDFNRLYGQAGVRASVPMFSIDPTVENDLFNVHGLAHKVVFSADASVSDASRNFTTLPTYDNLDDDAQEQFRRRFQINTFGGTIPARFDPRYYAVRSGLGGWVTSPSAEMVNDLAVVRMGARNVGKPNAACRGSEKSSTGSCWTPRSAIFPTPPATTLVRTLAC